MWWNGVLIGMAITQVHHRLTHKVQIQEKLALFAVVAGSTTTSSVGLPIATGAIRAAGASASAFVWFFRRTDVSPYPPNSAIAEFENENSHCIKLIKQKRQ